MEIVIASHNLHKIREFRDILKLFKHLDVLSLHHFPHYSLPKEMKDSFRENAEIKALHASRTLQKWVLADDSGLVVPALKGAPGVCSRTYANEDATDAENRQLLLKNMQAYQDMDRFAFFECALALASPQGLVKKTVSGICEGSIACEERGRNGFGFDSLFLKHDTNKTFAEVDEQTKNRISHRRKALEKLFGLLETLKPQDALLH